MEFFFDGTRWLYTELFLQPLGMAPGAAVLSATLGSTVYAPLPKVIGSDVWVQDLVTQFLVVTGGTALGASHKWVITQHKRPTGNTDTTYGTVNIDSGSSAVWRCKLQLLCRWLHCTVSSSTRPWFVQMTVDQITLM